MVKDKYNFIKQVLNNNKLNPRIRERILLLTSAEIERDKKNGFALEERVIKLEKWVGFKDGIELPYNKEGDIIFNSINNETLLESGIESNLDSQNKELLLSQINEPISEFKKQIVESNDEKSTPSKDENVPLKAKDNILHILKSAKVALERLFIRLTELFDLSFQHKVNQKDFNENVTTEEHSAEDLTIPVLHNPKEIDSIKSNNDTEAINPSLQSYYYPSGLYKFLLAYNQDPILKSTCHLIDSNELEKINEYCNTDIYNYDKHYAQIIESYNNIDRLFAPPYIKSLIRGYLTGKKYDGTMLRGWSDDKIEWHWCHKGIKNWANENPGVPPNPDAGLSDKLENGGFEFETPIKIKENYLQSLADLVIHFKKMFHIREDNSLLKILQGQNNHRKWIEKIDFILDKSSLPENIEFFTDIDKLLQSYNEIILLIIEYKKDEKPIVKLSLRETENSIYFSIHCINGVYGKSLSSAKSRLIGQKYEAIIKKLNGVCNIYLQADFGQHVFSKLSIWDSEWNTQKKRVEHPVDETFLGGVEHILEFKRN